MVCHPNPPNRLCTNSKAIKKTGLRAKSAKRSLSSKIAEFKQDQESHHENPLLKLLKTTKKEKQQAKSSSFNDKITSKVTFNLSAGVSKSALRRRKRKDKEQLKPKMDDLLQSLLETVNYVETKKEQKFIKSTAKPSNAPNPHKQSGHAKILESENKHFNQVLQNQQFKLSPFSALKEAIAQNLARST